MDKTALFVSGQEGYHTYRIPALVACGPVVLAFCEARKHTGSDCDKIDIVLRRSLDRGRTWGPRQTVVADGERTCGNPCPVVDGHTGTVWLPFCKDNQQVFVCRSGDAGATWATPLEITDGVKAPRWSYLGTGPGHGIQLRSGRLLLPCWADETPGPVTWAPSPNWGKVQSSFACYSDDHGATWQRGAKLETDASDECAVVEAADGDVYLNMRSRQDQRCRAWAWSRDGGETWSEVQYDPALPEPSCQGSLVRLAARTSSVPGGVLLSHLADPRQRAALTVRLSRDECRTWPVARVLEEGSAAYSDLAVTKGGRILCLYEADEYSRVVLARFGSDWLGHGREPLA